MIAGDGAQFNMVLFMAQRGAGVVRHLHRSKALSRPVRVAAIHTQTKRVSPVTNSVAPASFARNALPAGVRVSLLTNAYATAAGRPKTGAKKTTRTTKTANKGTRGSRSTKTAKSSKGTKSVKGKKTTKKAKPAPKPKKKVLTEKQKEQKEAKAKRDKLRELKATSLTVPKKLPDNHWIVGFQLKLSDALKTGQKAGEAFKSASTLAKAVSEDEKQVRCTRRCREISHMLLTIPDRGLLRSLSLIRLPTRPTMRIGSSPTHPYRLRRPIWHEKGSRSSLGRACARLSMTDWSSAPKRLT